MMSFYRFRSGLKMRTDRKNRVGILLLAWILSVFVLFDLYTLSANSSAQVSACSDAAPLVHAIRSQLLFPIRVPEKTSLRTESARKSEQLSEKENRQMSLQILFCILSLLMLTCSGTSIRHIFECLNLSPTRIVNFIHRKDGKGPHHFL